MLLCEELTISYHEMKLFKTYHSSYGFHRYADTTLVWNTIATTGTEIMKYSAFKEGSYMTEPLLLQVSKLKTTPSSHNANHYY